MLTHLLAFALNRPRGIEAVGNLVTRVAGLALATGFIFKALAGFMASLPGAQGPITAAQFLHALPTWWVPESGVGVAAWAIVLGTGLAVMLVGRDLRRQMEAF
ncbi:MAG TPA: hypothetical protein VHC20_04655 [Candidatus Paceibacterota bacterium]|nr:hypothetical protein [Candidatus Paceibacterota bacterium]